MHEKEIKLSPGKGIVLTIELESQPSFLNSGSPNSWTNQNFMCLGFVCGEDKGGKNKLTPTQITH